MHTSIPASATSDPRARVRPCSLRSPWGDVLVQLARSRGAVTGGIILAVLLVAAVGAPLLTPYDSLSMRPEERLQPPNRHHLFGTDVFGRDLWTRVLYGSRISLRTGVISITLAVALGVPLGLTSGYYGGSVDRLLMRLVDLMLTFPGILLALVIIAILGPNLLNAMLAVGISASPTYARVVRASVLGAREQVYVDAARAIGCRDGRRTSPAGSGTHGARSRSSVTWSGSAPWTRPGSSASRGSAMTGTLPSVTLPSTSSISPRPRTRTSNWPWRRSRPANTCCAKSRWRMTSGTHAGPPSLPGPGASSPSWGSPSVTAPVCSTPSP